MVAARRYPRTKTISGSRATSDLEPRAHDVVYGHGPQCLRRQPSLHAAFLEASKLLKRKVGSCATSMDVFLTSDGESNPVPFDRLKSAVSLGAPLVSVRYDAHSRHHYQRLRGRGHGHGHGHGRALRGVVDRLLTVLMAMLADQTTYDPARRQAVLAQAH